MLNYLRRSGGVSEPVLAPRTARAIAAATIVMLVLGAGLRLALSRYSLWFDEFASLFFASQPVDRLWSLWMLRETNPPLYYTFLREWIAIFGSSLMSVRTLSIAAGVAGIALAALLCRRFYGPSTALAVVVLASFSGHQIYYSHLARGYIFAWDGILLSIFGLLLFLSAADRTRPQWTGLTLYVLGAIIAIYCHVTMLLWPAVASVAVILTAGLELFRRRRQALIRLFLANLVIAVAAAWAIFIAAQQAGSENGNIGWIPRFSILDGLRLTAKMLLNARGNGLSDRAVQLVTLGLCLLAIGLTWRRRETRLLVVITPLWFVAFVLLSQVAPVIMEGTAYLLSVCPLLLSAIGLGAIPFARLRWGLFPIVAAVFLTNAWLMRTTFYAEDWTAALKQVARDPRGVVLIEGEAMTVILQQACRVTFATPQCPVPVVAMALPGDPHDVWARGLGPMPQHRWTDLPTLLGPERHIYTIRHAFAYDPATRVRGFAPNALRPPDRPFLAGPFRADQFDTGYRPPPPL